MARALSLQVVGEGTETSAQVGELRRLGCDLAQGYFFSPPISAAEISALLGRASGSVVLGESRSAGLH